MANQCATCGGEKVNGTTTFTADLEFGVVVIRNVPATVCNQCGDDWIEPETARTIDEIVEEAKEKQSQVEVVPYRQPAAS
jgi:YgiT-type zinc finger domain-containing protein